MPKQKKERDPDLYLKTLLAPAPPPSVADVEHKKLSLAMKMDRLERCNRARMEFTKIINHNNLEKRRMITSFTEKDFKKVSNQGMKDVDKAFGLLAEDHVKRDSLPKRMKILHQFCTKLELQEGHGLVKETDLPTMPKIASTQVLPLEYASLLKNEKPPIEMTSGGLLAVSLLQPYTMPAQAQRKQYNH